MRFFQIIWDDPHDPEGNVQHVGEHGLTIDEVEYVLNNATEWGTSQSSGRPCCFGYTPSSEYIIIVFEEPVAGVAYPVTAYQVPEP
ncbi:MAG: hypothetical protein WD872_11725 [Pirellulaceae bacterium]